jgi:hypothetical protein
MTQGGIDLNFIRKHCNVKSLDIVMVQLTSLFPVNSRNDDENSNWNIRTYS